MFIGFSSGNYLFRFLRKQVHLLDCPRSGVIIRIQAKENAFADEYAFRAGHGYGHRFAMFDGFLLFHIQVHESFLFVQFYSDE